MVRHFLLTVADRFVLMLPPNHTRLSLSQLAVTALTHVYHNLSHLKMYGVGAGKFGILQPSFILLSLSLTAPSVVIIPFAVKSDSLSLWVGAYEVSRLLKSTVSNS